MSVNLQILRIARLGREEVIVITRREGVLWEPEELLAQRMGKRRIIAEIGAGGTSSPEVN